MSKFTLKVDDGTLNADVRLLLRGLRQIDPDLRREVPDRIKGTPGVQGLLQDVRMRQPDRPTRGWHVGPSVRSRPVGQGKWNWSPTRIRQQITIQFRGSRPRGAPADSWPVLRVRSQNVAQNLFELADRGEYTDTAQGKALGARLSRYGPGAARTIWPAVERWARQIEDEIEEIFQEYADKVNRAARKAA